MGVIKEIFLLLTFFFAFAANKNCIAQLSNKQPATNKNSFFLNGKISLDSLTKYIHKSSGIRFSFNSVKVKGSKEINFPKGKYSFLEVLKQIKKTTSLYYSFYSGYVVFQDNPPKQLPKQAEAKDKIRAKEKPLKKESSKVQGKTSAKGNKGNEKKDTIIISVEIDTAKQNQLIATNAPGNTAKKDTGETSTINSLTDTARTRKSITDSVRAIVTDKKTSAVSASRDTNVVAPAKVVSVKASRSKKEINLQYGLQWNLNIPVYGFREYLTGTNGNNQAYNFLIPALWISKLIGGNNSEIQLTVKPGQQYFTGNKTAAIYTGPNSVLDTTSVRKNTIVLKTSGVYAGVQYNYHLNESWSAGGGINFHWQTGALINMQTTRLSNGVLASDSLYGIKKSSPDWQYLEPTFIAAKFEVSYRLKKFEIGGALFVPVTSLFASPVSATRPINGTIFLRWKLK